MKNNRSLIQFKRNPFDLFKVWFNEAKACEINDPNAMNLATTENNLLPNSRIVLMKSYSKSGFVFFTNLNSRKGCEIKNNINVALNFHWKSTLKQVRIRGTAKLVSNKEADKYFSTRPKDSQIGALVSKQSHELESREDLEKKIIKLKKIYKNRKIPRPSNWSGFRVKPISFEFWSQMQFRLHDRVQYSKIKDKWINKRLYP